MKAILNNALKVLTPGEKSKLLKLILLNSVINAFDIFFLVALLYVVNFYTDVTHHNLNILSSTIVTRHPLVVVAVFFILFSLKNCAAYFVIRSHYMFVYNAASRISKNKLTQYLQSDYSNYVEVDSSVHIHRISQQPIEFCHYVLKGILQISSEVILLLITLVAVVLYNAQVFLLLFALLVPPVLLVGYILKKKLHDARTNAKSTSEKSLQYLQEALSGYVECKIYDKEKFFTNRYYEQQNMLNTYLSKQQIIQNVPPRVIEIFAVFGLFVLVIINTISTNAAALPFITIGAFVAASYKIIPGIVKILNGIGQVKTYAYTCKELVSSGPNEKVTGNNEISPIQSFEMNKVSFKYKKAEVLNDFSIKVEKGDFLGMSGASGKGKTSMLNLLLGFISPVHGSISINDIETLQAEFCWKNISYVKQQPFLINDTIKTNITLKHESCRDDKKLLAVMRITGVEKIVQMCSEGINSLVTENGKNLSGGQRQRIALARALYKDFDLLVLDEPFSELDEESETNIMGYLKEIAANGKMVVLITHNKNSLSFCNKIVSMDELN